MGKMLCAGMVPGVRRGKRTLPPICPRVVPEDEAGKGGGSAWKNWSGCLNCSRKRNVQTSTAHLENSTQINELKAEYNRIDTDTEFNKKKLLNGSYKNQYLQLGANTGQGISVNISSTAWQAVTVTAGDKTVTNQISIVDKMLDNVSTVRSKLGAIQNRLEYTVKVDDNTAENMSAAESRIRDTDMADEMTRFSKESILQQAATSMLAQANQANQGVLSLLQ